MISPICDSCLLSSVYGLGKTSDVGGCLPQKFRTTRPPFQHHSQESQEVSMPKTWVPSRGTPSGTRSSTLPKCLVFQVLPACHHLEHQGRHLGWEEHHRGGYEWHLRQRVRTADRLPQAGGGGNGLSLGAPVGGAHHVFLVWPAMGVPGTAKCRRGREEKSV